MYKRQGRHSYENGKCTVCGAAQPGQGAGEGAAPAPAQATLEDIERQAIAAALVRFGGNISQTAFALGVSRPTLYRKMSKYGLEE